MATINVCNICRKECTPMTEYKGIKYRNCEAGSLVLKGATGIYDKDGILEYMDTGSLNLEHLCVDCAVILNGVIGKMKDAYR